jgi:hypothetical protein
MVSTDAYGNATYSPDYTVFTGDTTNPSVSLTSPSAGTVSGTVTLTATASDNVSVAGVLFYLDDTSLGSEVTTAPYSTTWDSTAVTDGAYSIIAVARDTSNHYATSTVAVTVSNVVTPTPTPTPTPTTTVVVPPSSSSSSSSGGGGGTVSPQQLAKIIAPSASTTEYLNNLSGASSTPGCPSGFTCTLIS